MNHIFHTHKKTCVIVISPLSSENLKGQGNIPFTLLCAVPLRLDKGFYFPTEIFTTFWKFDAIYFTDQSKCKNYQNGKKDGKWKYKQRGSSDPPDPPPLGDVLVWELKSLGINV